MKEYEVGVCYMVLNDQLNQDFVTKMQLVIEKKP